MLVTIISHQKKATVAGYNSRKVYRMRFRFIDLLQPTAARGVVQKFRGPHDRFTGSSGIRTLTMTRDPLVVAETRLLIDLSYFVSER